MPILASVSKARPPSRPGFRPGSAITDGASGVIRASGPATSLHGALVTGGVVGSGDPAAAAGSSETWICQPANGSAVPILSDASVNAGPVGSQLEPNEEFRVSQEVVGTDGIRHLRLADGRGWVYAEWPPIGVMCVPKPNLLAVVPPLQSLPASGGGVMDGVLSRVPARNVR